jgi:hypothetical protein
MASMLSRPINVLVGAASVVAATTLALPNVTGYGTVLDQLVGFSAWAILAKVTSGLYADTHHPVLWFVAVGTNLTAFLVPEALIWFRSRKRWPLICSVATLAWCGFYVASLFWLFPATDGP